MVLLIGTMRGGGIEFFDILPYLFLLCFWLLPWIASAYVARRRGYDSFVFGVIGFLLGLPGLLLTIAATSPSRGSKSVRAVMDHILRDGTILSINEDQIRERIKNCLGKSLTIDDFIELHHKRFSPFLKQARETKAMPAFLEGVQSYLRLEETMTFWKDISLMALVTYGAIMMISLYAFNYYLFPIYISFAVGMNLSLPFSIKFLIALCRMTRSPLGIILLWIAWIISPVVIHRAYHSLISYKMPIVGKVKLEADFITYLKGLNFAILSGFELQEARLQALELSSSYMKAYLSYDEEESASSKISNETEEAFPDFPVHFSSLLNKAQSEGLLAPVLSKLCEDGENRLSKAFIRCAAVIAVVLMFIAAFTWLYVATSICMSFYQ